MKILLALLLLIPSLSWGDIEVYLDCQVEETEIFTKDRIISDKSDTKFYLELTIYENKCLSQPGTADTIRPELSGSCLKAKVFIGELGFCKNLYTINSIEDEIIAYSDRLSCADGSSFPKNLDTYLRLNRNNGNFFLSHSYLHSCEDCVKKVNLMGACQKKTSIY